MPPTSSSSSRALDSLYRDHQSWLQSWLRKSLGCRDSAADLTQDTFVRILGRPLDLSALHTPRAYLTTIARGLLIDFFRRQDLERAYLADLAALPEVLQPSPEEKLAAVQGLQAVDAILQDMTPKTRAAWLMNRVDGMSHAEIATALQVSVPRVRQYLASATRQAYRARYPQS